MDFILYLSENKIEQPVFYTQTKLCSCLLDQDRRIGNDPVGYKCSNLATEVVEVTFTPLETGFADGLTLEFDVCASCRQLIYENTGRTTFNTLSGRIKYDDARI